MGLSGTGKNIFRMNESREDLSLIRRQWAEAEAVAVLTGAGASAESGIPTFREAQQGLWAQYQPEELATPGAFRAHPRRVLQWYRWRLKLIDEAQPNPGHLALAELERTAEAGGKSFCLITQNVDGLHQAAGSREVIELHGRIHDLKCFQCGKPSQRALSAWDDEQELPRCAHCQGLLRPDVVWFGESLSEASLTQAQQAARSSQVFLTAGTSAVVQPAASLPLIAHSQGAFLIEINPQTTGLSSRADVHLRSPFGESLPRLTAALST